MAHVPRTFAQVAAGWRALSFLALSARLFGQEPILGPAPGPPAAPPAFPLVSGAETALGVQANPWIDTSSREAVRLSYNAAIAATEGTGMSWTGNIAACAEGSVSNTYRSVVLQRANWFRGMAGVPNTVTLDTATVNPAAKAALIMSANRVLNHFPPASSVCYTAPGAAAAGKSNLCLLWNQPDIGCVTGYIRDWGASNAVAGHRRWILYPQTTAFGTGDVDQTGTYPAGYPIANALYVIQDSTYFSPRPATRDNFVAWPPPGYVPYQAVYPRWSFSYPLANFDTATVTLSRGGATVPAVVESRANGYGENTIVWAADGLDPNSFTAAWPKPSSDTVIRVTVGNVFVSGTPRTFTYDVTIFDPASSGGITLVPPSNPSPANGAAGVSASSVLSWTGSSSATAYDIYFGPAATPPLAGSTSATSFSPGPLQASTTYYWRVEAKNGPVAVSSPSWTFTTAAGTGGSNPIITSPSPGQTLLTGGVTFAWSAVTGSGGYNMKVTSGQSTVFEGNLAGASSTTTLISLTDGAYSFSVRSCTGGFAPANCGAYSTVQFTVDRVKPTAAPTITSPAEGSTFNSSTHQFSWTSILGASRYEILLRDMGANGATALSMANAGSPPATVTTFSMKSSVNYRLEVRACSSACGPWSTAVNFAVDLPPVPAQAPSTPVCNVLGNQASCSWSPVTNADLYVVEAVQSGAGPGGGALTVASSRVSAASAVLSIPSGPMIVVVKACNGNGCGPTSPSLNIIGNGPNPASPVLGNPVGGTAIDGPLVFFSWNRIPGDNGTNTVYRLYVQDFSLSRPALDVLTRNNYWAAKFRGSGNRYDALVIANPGSGQVAGPAVPFTVQGSDPGSPTLVEPRHQDAGVTSAIPLAGNVQLGWTPISGAALYEYYVVKAGDPVPVGRGITPGLNVQIPLAGAGQYSGIVRSCPSTSACTFTSDANWGPWSSAAGGTGVTTFQVQ